MSQFKLNFLTGELFYYIYYQILKRNVNNRRLSDAGEDLTDFGKPNNGGEV